MTLTALLAYAISPDNSTAGCTAPGSADDTTVSALRGDNDDAARQALEELFQRLRISLTRFAQRVGAEDFAGDIVTDVFATLWIRRKTLEPTLHPEPYLYRAVRNRTLQWLRGEDRAFRRARRIAEEVLDHEGSTMSRTTDASKVMAAVWSAIDALPESQRTALTLRFSHGFSLAMVAESMEVSIPAVKMLLQRAFKVLRVRLAPLLDDLSD